ncbi:MAG: type I-C CRISPR-associated protein Cas8c/Csd1 [Eubacteriales bacterium]
MSWLGILSETYDNLMKCDYDSRRNLLPIAHSTQKAHITVVIDQNGNFVRGEFVADVEGKEKNLSQTLIPVSEKSASRSGKIIAPHPLCDKLKYLAGDYSQYVEEDNAECFFAYSNQLEQWMNFDKTNNKLRIIYEYVRKKSLISDLIKSRILSIDTNGMLTNKWENAQVKLTVGNQSEGFVRFEILNSDVQTKCWQDIKLQDSYMRFYINTQKENDLCYMSGCYVNCSKNHPSKIRHSGDKAKLISANDTSGYTFRGRFQYSSQAVQIGYEASQKAHNALKFLLEKQGERVGEKMFLLWGTEGENTPKLNVGTDELDDILEDLLKDAEDSGNVASSDTLQDYSKKLGQAMKGYRECVTPYTRYALIGLDAATTGRMAVVYYREYFGEDIISFLNSIESWHETAGWFHRFKKKYFYGAPAPYDIALCAFGTEQSDFLGGNDKIIANTVERILPCISDGAKVPRDIVKALLNKCYSPQSYEKDYNWNKVLSVTCSMYRKYLWDYQGEKIEMKIDENYTDISYLCGRLLAVADEIERFALSEQNKEAVRSTNAMRYFSKFMQYPNNTWGVIDQKIQYHIMILGNKANYLLQLKEEISDKIDPDDFANARNLDGKAALGFDSQKKAIRDRNMAISNKKKGEDK